MDKNVSKVRNAIEARGGYLMFIYRQMKLEGIDDVKGILCRAVSAWGKNKVLDGGYHTPRKFVERLELGNHPEVYERKTLRSDDDAGLVEMRFCPLLKAWQDSGASEDEIKDLCDIASEGDYTSVGNRLRLSFDERLADGQERCLMRIVKIGV